MIKTKRQLGPSLFGNRTTRPLSTDGSWWRRALRAVLGPVEEDRTALLRYLAIPLLLAALAFVLAVALTVTGAPKIGTLRSTVAGLAYVYLMLGVVWLPAYAVGFAVFWWNTRGDNARLLFQLYWVPAVSALFLWFPTLVMDGSARAAKVQLIIPLLGTGLILGYLWIGLVRLMFYVWRKK